MFKDIAERLVSGLTQIPEFNPADLNDPIAERTMWVGMKEVNSWSQRGHELFKDSRSLWGFRAKKSGMIGIVLLALLDLSLLIGGVYFCLNGHFRTCLPLFFMTLLLGLVIVLFVQNYRTHCFFDIKKGIFWKGKSSSSKEKCKLADIHAIQLLKGLSSSTGHGSQTGSFNHSRRRVINYYQILLVLKDGTRIRVSENRGAEKMNQTAMRLADFLSVKYWNGVNLLQGKRPPNSLSELDFI